VSYQPELYDAVTPASFRGDSEYYCRKARESGGPVLELGAGTGRITLAIAEAGVPIHALDANPGMLAVLRRKLADRPSDVQRRVQLIESDMRSFDLPARFALIVAPFRAFLHNVSEGDQLACLRQVRAHLRPAGEFAFNVYHPSLEYMSRNSGALEGVWRWSGTYERDDGGCVVRSEATRYDTVRQRLRSEHRFEEFAADGTLTRTSLHRLELAYLYPPDIRRLLDEAGFQSVQIAGGFDGRPFANDTDELVVEARIAPDTIEVGKLTPMPGTTTHRVQIDQRFD
jgi:SAM-dependent methyltransferase